jgi:DAACS family dicarboxylate/amino acid:cation (Na+ or H+) symporter
MHRTTWILVGLIAGATLGGLANLLVDPSVVRAGIRYGTDPVGRMWLAGLIMVVIPLILSTLALGVASLGSLRRVGRIGLLALLGFLGLTTLSTALGLGLMAAIRPGAGLDPDVAARLMETFRGRTPGAMGLGDTGFGIELLVRIVPRNPVQAMAGGEMLAVIFMALVLGTALTLIPRDKAEPLERLLDSVSHVCGAIIDLVMKLAPVGVFCLVFTVVAQFGFDLLRNLAWFVGTVLLGLVLFQVVAYPLILKLVARRSPVDFLRRSRLVMLTAFSTSSSNATLPTTLRVGQEELGIPREVAGFVLPLGATMNMNGTALFEGATVLFLAQVFGVELTAVQQVVVMLMAVVTAIGVAGIPGGSIPLLMAVLGLVGVPPEGIAIVLGVDRILDMCRTVLNVTGDLVTAAVVQRFSGSDQATTR